MPIHHTTFMGLRWRLGVVHRWNFYTGAFLAENFLSVFLPNFWLWGDFSEVRYYLQISVLKNIWPLRKSASFEPLCVKIRRPVWPVGRSTKKCIYTIEKNLLYFTHLPRSPQWTDLQEILHGGSPCRRNHSFQILCWSVEGFWICAGWNFAILHFLSRSPLTQGWRYGAACDSVLR